MSKGKAPVLKWLELLSQKAVYTTGQLSWGCMYPKGRKKQELRGSLPEKEKCVYEQEKQKSQERKMTEWLVPRLL